MLNRIFKLLLAAIVFSSFFGSIAGCSAVASVGQGVENTGHALTREANEHKNY